MILLAKARHPCTPPVDRETEELLKSGEIKSLTAIVCQSARDCRSGAPPRRHSGPSCSSSTKKSRFKIIICTRVVRTSWCNAKNSPTASGSAQWVSRGWTHPAARLRDGSGPLYSRARPCCGGNAGVITHAGVVHKRQQRPCASQQSNRQSFQSCCLSPSHTLTHPKRRCLVWRRTFNQDLKFSGLFLMLMKVGNGSD